jgi:hypothetical protein
MKSIASVLQLAINMGSRNVLPNPFIVFFVVP